MPEHAWSTQIVEFGAAEDGALEAGRVAEAVELNVTLWAGEADEAVQALVRKMQEQAFQLQLAVQLDEVALDPPVSASVRRAATGLPSPTETATSRTSS